MKRNLLFLALLLISLFVFATTLAQEDPLGSAVSGDFEYAYFSDGTACITRYTGSATNLILPSELEGHPITVIGDRAFNNCKNLTSISLP